MTAVIGLLMAATAFAFEPVPKESAKALGITRGKDISKGVVFVNGKYIAPPYVVERRGTGIRINGQAVTGQVVAWDEFLKTQEGVKVTKTETAPEPAPAPVEEEEPAAEETVEDDSLDDLFDDAPAKDSGKRKPAVRRPVIVARPKAQVSYQLEGEFVPNDASKALVARINAVRTDIDKWLRAGGFLCFGDGYSRVSGDARTLKSLLKVLPELQQKSESVDAFREGVRSSNLVFLNEALAADLFRNRVDYVKLKDRREKLNGDQGWKRELEDVATPLF